MFKRSLLLASLMLLARIATFAQLIDDSLAIPEDTRSRRFILSTSLFEYLPSLNLNAGTINLGGEFYLGSQKSIFANVGWVKSYGTTNADGELAIPATNTQGMKVQLELRHYFRYHPNSSFNTKGMYVAAHGFFQGTETTRPETVLDYVDDVPLPGSEHYKENTYTVSRTIYGLAAKFGFQHLISYGFVVDGSVGLGAQYITSSSANKLGSDNTPDRPWNKAFDNGSGIFPNAMVHLRIGWAF